MLRALRNTTRITHVLFLVLFALALIFFRERLFVDSSYYIARVIHSRGFWIEHNRYILAFSQWLALLGVYLGLSLKTVLILYSLGHVLFFYIVFLLARYTFRDEQAGIFLIALQTIGICYGWFTPMFELYYGCALLVLVNSMLNVYLYEKGRLFTICLVSFLALMSHPFVLFLFIFMLYIKFRRKLLADRKTWIAVAGIVLLAVSVKFLHSSAYEKDKTESMVEAYHQNYLGFRYFLSLLLFLLKQYWDVVILLILSFYFLYQKRENRKIILSLTFLVFVLFLINLLNYGFDHTRYQEQAYFPIVFAAVFLFLYAAPGTLYSRGILLSLILIRLCILVSTSGKFVQRTEKMEILIATAKKESGSKFYVENAVLPKGEMDPTNWSYPIEILLLSSLENTSTSITICTEEDLLWNGNNTKLDEHKFLFRRYEIFEDSSVNASYFSIKKGLYKSLKTPP